MTSRMIYMPPLLIAVSGKLGSGKDYIIENYILPCIHGRVSKMAFADHIKINVASQQHLPLDILLHGQKTAEVRHALQSAGTEEGRDKHGPDIWVNTLDNWIKLRQLRGDDLEVVLVTDCRFPNEARWIEDNDGILIRIVAPDRNDATLLKEANGDEQVYTSIKTHISETALDNYTFRYVIDNSKEAAAGVHEQVRRMLYEYIRSHLNRSDLFKVPIKR